MRCGCSSIACRGIVRDFKWLPPNQRRKYLQLGVVQYYIARKYRKPDLPLPGFKAAASL